MFHTAFIDFDNTLYDTRAFVEDATAALLSYGVSRRDADTSFDRAVHGDSGTFFDYTFERHLALLSEMGYGLPLARVKDDLSGLFARSYQFPDAVEFLVGLRKQCQSALLLTAGNGLFQKWKLSSTTLSEFLDNVHILHEKKEEYVRVVAAPDMRHLFVNDNLEENRRVRAACRNVLVLTKRHPVKYSEDELRASGIPYFNSLADILLYVKRNSK